jgi:hypothetical protein
MVRLRNIVIQINIGKQLKDLEVIIFIINEMAALVNALDISTPKQYGQKGAIEYGWSNDIREKVLQFSGQIVRSNPERIEEMADKLRELLRRLSLKDSQAILLEAERKELLVVLYKLIGLTRDMVDGKGEYALAYMQVFVWYEFYPTLANFALEKFVLLDKEHPYGSWKDMKYFCNYVIDKTNNEEHPLVEYACDLIIRQIHLDLESTNVTSKSLVGKWVPREKCHKFGWLFIILAGKYFSHYLDTAKTHDQRVKAFSKCKMEFRKICSGLNKELDTVQIKQCAKVWSSIDHSKTTSITNSRQKKAFLNVNKKGEQRSQEYDRVACAENYKNRIQAAVSGAGPEIKGKRVGLDDFAKEAMKLCCQFSGGSVQLEKDALNSQWRDNSKLTGALGEMIAVVDTSGSMTSAGAIYPALSLGIRVAEKSKLGKRVITFSANPTWHNLEGIDNYVDCVKELQKASWGMTTDFLKMFDMILNAIIEKKLTPVDAKGFVLAVFSDMQFDAAAGGNMDTIYEVMTKKYAEAGQRLHGEPFELPHLLFWNMSAGNGFPVMSTFKNTTFVSGYNPSQLNLFCEKGLDFLSTMTPWSMLVQSIDKPRYKCLEQQILEFFECPTL